MKSKLALIAAGAVALVGLSAGAASAATTVTIHPGDLDTSGLNDVRTSGHYGFLDDGLAVGTDDASSQAKVALYWDVAPQNGLPGAVSLSWSGSQPQPGTQTVFDVDGTTGNGNDFNILVGEPIYTVGGVQDYWYTGGQAKAATHGFTCPETTGGSGSDCHGTLVEWQNAIPNAHVGAYGFSLGSGVQGGGIIHSLTVDSTVYKFSGTTPATPPTPTAVTGSSSVVRGLTAHGNQKVAFVLHANALGANQVESQPLSWEIRDNGLSILTLSQHAGQVKTVRTQFDKHTGKHVVTLLKNGNVVRTIVIRTH